MKVYGRFNSVFRHVKNTLKIIGAFCVTFLLGWLIHSFLWVQYTVVKNGQEPVFYPGDRVVVNRMSYGLRLPFEGWLGYHRWGENKPLVGDWIVYNNPVDKEKNIADRSLYLGHCIAVPGDTVWFTWNQSLASKNLGSSSFPFVIPGKGYPVEVTPWNIRLLCNTLNKHEGKGSVIFKDSILLVDGLPRKKIVFSQDYFWVHSGRRLNSGDSRLFGFIPMSHLLGKAFMISYSFDSKQSFFYKIRSSRLFIPLHE